MDARIEENEMANENEKQTPEKGCSGSAPLFVGLPSKAETPPC